MLFRNIVLCGLACAAFLLKASAQYPHMKFTHLNVVDGLSQNTVYAISQDYLGLMWIGTRDGLNKYDAGSVTVYRNAPNDTTSLTDNFIQAVFEDQYHRLWIGTSNGLNLYDRALDRFIRIPLDHGEPSVYAITDDKKGDVWIATNGGLFRIGEDVPPNIKSIFSKYEVVIDTTNHVFSKVRCLFAGADGLLWLGTESGLLSVMVDEKQPDKLTVEHYYVKGKTKGSLTDNWINTIVEVEKDKLWIGTKSGGINILDRKTNTFTYHKHFPGMEQGLPDNDVRSIVKDRRENIWLGTFKGLSLYRDGAFYTYTDQQSSGISNNSVRPIFQDNRGSIWVGTYFGGVSILDPDIPNFHNFYHHPNTNSLTYNVVSSFIQAPTGDLWIGTEGGGLNHYDITTGQFTSFQHDPQHKGSLSHNNVKSLCLDNEGTLWVGTFQGGLNALKKGEQTFVTFKHDPGDPRSLSENRIYAVIQDRQGDLYIGTYGGGLNIKRKNNTDSFEVLRQPQISSDHIRSLFEDSRGNLWVGTQNGLNLKRPGEDTFTVLKSDPTDPNTISGNVVISIFEDNRGNIWIGTYNDGLNRYNPRDHTFTRYNQGNGLPGNNIFGILEDKLGNLWLSTNGGLCRFNPMSGLVRNYDTADGLNSNEFNFGAYSQLENGHMVFGNARGFTLFAPDSMKVNSFVPQVVFSDFKLFNKSLAPGTSDVLPQHISVTKSITLPHDQHVFSVEFAVLNYIIPKKNKYAYKLEGFDNEWNYVETPVASYTNLNAGHYTLLVKGANNDGIWNDTPVALDIHILPPPWKTWWAYLVYAVITGIAVYICLKFVNARNKLKHDLLIEHMALEKEREIHEEKLNFFANVSHEFRTPLSLIIGPVERLLDEPSLPHTYQSLLHTAQRNSRRLLRLVDQILDFRKQESGLMRLHVSRIEMAGFLGQLIDTFGYLADEKRITLRFDNVLGHPQMLWADPDQLEKVVFNLLSNAFKFTPAGGNIHVKLGKIPPSDTYPEGAVQIIVEDSGIGIPEDRQDAIFGQFYQAHSPESNNSRSVSGSGIGLALSDGLVKLHGGKITVVSNLRNDVTDLCEINTRFTILLPMGKNHFSQQVLLNTEEHGTYCELPESVIPSSFYNDSENESLNKDPKPDRDRPLILVVDDNDELRSFIADGLRGRYSVIEASDGSEAWELIGKTQPDIVISDVMMPISNGMELLKKIKSENETNHIAVILLTARTAPEHVIAALERGSDDYITKPFSFQVLVLKISNILQTREGIRRKFIREYLLEPALPMPEITTTHDVLAKIIEIVEQNLTQSEFNVNMLATEIGISRTALFQKVKQLTGLNIIELINSIRLRKAARLLEYPHQLTISEVAYQVGFNDPKYFSRSFKSFFGMSPREYMQSAQVNQ
ncbi:hybrid sensor histidine kinase/response regulator transcription factor [Parapedobacter soli]|uniref:hybrid sensor histidine kinase/response regulator transcription factor n=1 Tax=Parapedobacter soli TaxID=416955 RepID=UPI0021C98441|nr:two-component regulator propeller domain-containing protein [Parapedobacter soli]